MKENAPSVYFYVGMGKVASTYLREAFFPRLQGAYVIPRRDRFDAVQIMKAGQHQKYILCKALDTNMEEGIADVALAFPDAHPIIVFRAPESWIMSQYRRWVKNGFPGSLQTFIDVEQDQGYWRREELLFMNKIRLLEHYFTSRPLVLFYDDLRKDPRSFFDRVARFTGCTYRFEDIPLTPRHTSHDERGLVLRRSIRRRFSNRMPSYTRIPVLHWIQRRALMLFAYFTVWLAKRLPASWLPDEPLADPDYMEKIRSYASADWMQLQAYASAHQE